WRADPVRHVWSSTKGATALCAHLLADRALLDLDAPVVQYWPEFGQQGKDAITVAMLLSHQAGLPAVRTPLPAGAFYDWDLMTSSLAAETPFCEPGTRNGSTAPVSGSGVGGGAGAGGGRAVGTSSHGGRAPPRGLAFWRGPPEGGAPPRAPTPPADPGPLPAFYLEAFSDPTSIPGLV